MKTFENLMVPNSVEQLTLFAADTLVNRSAQRESKKDRTIRDISGLRCLELFKTSGQDGIVCENVYGHVVHGLYEVCAQIRAEGYKSFPFCVPASAIGLERIRQRVWIISYAESAGKRRETRNVFKANGGSNRQLPLKFHSSSEIVDRWRKHPQPMLNRGDYGFSEGVDRNRALGNAVVPQIPFLIGNAILEFERKNTKKTN